MQLKGNTLCKNYSIAFLSLVPSDGTKRDMSLPPTSDDIYQCSCHISARDVATLAAVLNVPGEELDGIKASHPTDARLQSLQLLKVWCNSTHGSRQELSQFLVNLNMKKAAKRYVCMQEPITRSNLNSALVTKHLPYMEMHLQG